MGEADDAARGYGGCVRLSGSSAHGYTLYGGAQKYESAWEGLIYADHSNGAVLRIRMECIGIPMNFPYII